MGAMDVLKKWDFYKKIPEVRPATNAKAINHGQLMLTSCAVQCNALINCGRT